MAHYKVVVLVKGEDKPHTAIRESEVEFPEYWTVMERRAKKHYPPGTILYFDVYLLSPYSPEVKQLKGKRKVKAPHYSWEGKPANEVAKRIKRMEL